jgi:hypothetical protein
MKAPLRLCACLAPGLLLAWHRIDSADIWFHLATGERILHTHALPATDVFGSVPGRPWIVHDWLAGSFSRSCIGWVVPPRSWSRRRSFWAAAIAWPWIAARRAGLPTWPFEIAILVTTGLAYERFLVRPELFTLVWPWHGRSSSWPAGQRDRRGLATMAVAQALWANLHAAFLIGTCDCRARGRR